MENSALFSEPINLAEDDSHLHFPDEALIPSSAKDHLAHPLDGISGSVCGDDEHLSGHPEYTSSVSSTDELVQVKSRTSSQSSFSSMPDSVVVHRSKDQEFGCPIAGIDARGQDGADNENKMAKGKQRPSGIGYGTLRSLYNVREREVAFRHPSSVREMQLHTEDEDADDDEYLTPPRRRIHGRSPGSTPLKRSPYYSPSGASPSRNKPEPVKKEYPLVLLHCNLLPPTLSLSATIGVPDQRILKEVLPPQYWRRWKLLEEKVGFGVVRDRGVLISHPQDMYDLLEERLLESLELQRPRLQDGHFLGQDEGDSEKEDMEQLEGEESATDDEQGEACPDCGRKVARQGGESDCGKRKWEIRVFAANGLMRAGAWAAAWKEMEKVDVEVGLWLPSDVRRELERKALEEGLIYYDAQRVISSQTVTGETQPPSQPIHLSSAQECRTQEQIDGLDDSTKSIPMSTLADPAPNKSVASHNHRADDIDLHVLLKNYLRLLASDGRNIALVILSILVIVLAIVARPMGENIQPLLRENLLDPSPRPIVHMPQTAALHVGSSNSRPPIVRSFLPAGSAAPSSGYAGSRGESALPGGAELAEIRN
ncbi:hypothetical protein MPDQ_003341 [Monascus purpureus]|uniref:Uncharacterized protein n=1 Tax=Monascus purpureus TaxID=5098 RepID=A0A507QND3_MONPU|nr:hypothetical protein MPDQ_003341 [Monascus purpureus]BDD57238.1 hypothetical protein MAP00_002622 [Monascus purpureus]